MSNNNQEVKGISATYAESNVVVDANAMNILNLNNLSSLVSTTLALNSAVSNIYGVDVKWFRAIPQERSKDVLFLEWTLYNVESCPLSIKAIYNDTNYDDAALTYNMMGIEYAIPLTMSISILDWQKATNYDESVPSKGDIIYIPQSNKLYEVVSMTPQKTVASQITNYKVNLQKYQPKRNRFLGDDLANTIDNYTNGVEKLFGEDIKEEIKDIVNDKQLSPYNSTYKMDKYKNVFDKKSLIVEDIYCDGHTIAKGYYKNSPNYDTLVTYNVGEDVISKDSYRVFSCLIKFDFSKSIKHSNIKIDKLKSKNSNYHTYIINNSLTSGKITLYNELFSIYGEYDNVKKELKISNKSVESFEEDWYEDEKFNTIIDTNNILSSDNFDIKLLGNNTLVLNISGKDYTFISDVSLEEGKWYNIVLSIGKKTTVKIFSVNNELSLLYSEEKQTKKWDNFINTKYEIKGGNNNLTNVRLYNQPLEDEEKYIFNAVTYLGSDDSKLIISDNVDAFFHNAYYGNQR